MKKVIVTGAFGALGREVAAVLTERGHTVAAVDMAEGKDAPDACIAFSGIDLTNEAEVSEAYASVLEHIGRIDALVNIAGGFVWEEFETGSLESWDLMHKTNLTTAVVSSRVALPALLRTRGSIVNIGAAVAERPSAGLAPYAASKAGVRSLTECMAAEFRNKGLRVNLLLPTIIDTPANRASMPTADTSHWLKPRSIGNVVAFLISEDAEAVTGASIVLSG